MLTGKPLGHAIAAAIKLKGVPKADVARHFGIKPPSISDWCNKGTIDKAKLERLFDYFSDVVGPAHWGLKTSTMVSEPVSNYKVVKTIDHKRNKGITDLTALYLAMSDDARHQLMGMAKLLAHQYPRANANRAS